MEKLVIEYRREEEEQQYKSGIEWSLAKGLRSTILRSTLVRKESQKIDQDFSKKSGFLNIPLKYSKDLCKGLLI